jgi:hypothetical protein
VIYSLAKAVNFLFAAVWLMVCGSVFLAIVGVGMVFAFGKCLEELE